MSYITFLGLYTYMLLVDFQRHPSGLEYVLMLWIFCLFVGEIHTVCIPVWFYLWLFSDKMYRHLRTETDVWLFMYRWLHQFGMGSIINVVNESLPLTKNLLVFWQHIQSELLAKIVHFYFFNIQFKLFPLRKRLIISVYIFYIHCK